MVPVGGTPSSAENIDLAASLTGYAHRSGPDDFGSLTTFLDAHPDSPWSTALLTDLGLEYYNTAHYSLALDAWHKAWESGQQAGDARGVALTDRAGAELALMYARLGRMPELEAFLTSVDNRGFVGPATEKLASAREGLWTMQNRPGLAFRCGPLALHCIAKVVSPDKADAQELLKAASTQQGFSLTQVAVLSQEIGLNYQMAFREANGDFAVPAVVHWKVGHYAAILRKQGDRYLIQDPTFRNSVWATKAALEAESSGYFLIGPGSLPPGWRTVDETEGSSVWGKGTTYENDPGPITPRDLKKGPPMCMGMMVPNVHLMTANLSLADQPVGYRPPVGPAVPFTVRYNSQDSFQPANFNYGNLGSKWTCDWTMYITDNPQSPLADVTYYVGGGQRTFTGFNTNTQSFDYQQYDQTLLTRTSTNPINYQLLSGDGTQLIFSQSDGSIGTSRNIFLTQVIDSQGNALALTYDTNLLLVSITDAIGQVTTFTYGVPTNSTYGLAADQYKLMKVTDPFGRSASFQYGPLIYEELIVYNNGVPETGGNLYYWDLVSVTDVVGIVSQVGYAPELYDQTAHASYFYDFVNSLTTPYGTTYFSGGGTNETRFLETTYPDGSRDRVEFNQSVNVPGSDPNLSVPQGMSTADIFLNSRNTYYWDQNACAMAYGDYSKAAVFHWLHAEDFNTCSGILESSRKALEGRVWYDYAGQSVPYEVGVNNCPLHAGRVLDDGSTQLYSYGYNGFGHLTNSIDPVGRTFSYFYDTNGIDLLQIRQTRGTNNDLIARVTYNNQHLPLSVVDASGQTNIFTYNPRGQILTATDAKGETTSYSYDPNGYPLSMDGPLPGTNDTVTLTYDSFGRVRTSTDVSGYTLIYDYDNLDRI
ncbi:MAG: cysteine peptidase family C39 domain-containing protein, partial [Verrucomicrobiota bacterium]